jgi:gamma-glutamyltranspeptidase/glutathione hydrolase
MSPTLVFNPDGSLFASVGSPGGSRIIEFVSRTLVGLIDWQLPMQEAIDLGNVNNRNRKTELEAGTGAEGFAGYFKSMGHEVLVKPLVSGLHGVRITADGMDGGADKRREGLVIELGK